VSPQSAHTPMAERMSRKLRRLLVKALSKETL